MFIYLLYTNKNYSLFKYKGMKSYNNYNNNINVIITNNVVLEISRTLAEENWICQIRNWSLMEQQIQRSEEGKLDACATFVVNAVREWSLAFYYNQIPNSSTCSEHWR